MDKINYYEMAVNPPFISHKIKIKKMSTIKRLKIPKIEALELENVTTNISGEIYEIKSIKIGSVLDNGSANDGSTNNGKKIKLQEGILYGKNYTFEVTEYVGKRTTELTSIKWEIFYNDFDTGEIVNLPINARGERITINMGNLESCGRYLYIRAYIKDKKNTAVLKVWKHNRFRWFDQVLFESELADRIQPWKINQSGTSLCGMACLFYLFAKENPSEYRNFCRDLFRKGEAKYNNYIVKPSKELLEKKVNKLGLPEKTGNMPITDYITLAGLRNTNNSSYKGGDENIQAINWPDTMIELSREFLGYADIEENGSERFIKRINHNQGDITNIINDINKQIADGYHVILMVDSDLINDDLDFQSFDYHWIVLESAINGEFEVLNQNGQLEYLVDFLAYSWGTNPFDRRDIVKDKNGQNISNQDKGFLKKPITRKHFINNYYGYIKVK